MSSDHGAGPVATGTAGETEPTVTGPADPGPAGPELADPGPAGERQPDWWHRDHPTFTALSGFFTGLVLACVVPGAYLALLDALFDTETVKDLFPFVLVVLALPAGLLANARTRRFGGYLLIGMSVTLLVVLGVGWLVVWVMLKTQA